MNGSTLEKIPALILKNRFDALNETRIPEFRTSIEGHTQEKSHIVVQSVIRPSHSQAH